MPYTLYQQNQEGNQGHLVAQTEAEEFVIEGGQFQIEGWNNVVEAEPANVPEATIEMDPEFYFLENSNNPEEIWQVIIVEAQGNTMVFRMHDL